MRALWVFCLKQTLFERGKVTLKEKNITKMMSGAAMAAMMMSPAGIAAAENVSTLDNPSGGDPISVEHPLDTEQGNGTNEVRGSGAQQAKGATKENTVLGAGASVTVYDGEKDASFDTVIGHGSKVNGSGGTAVGTASKVDGRLGGTEDGAAASATGDQMATAVGFLSDAEGKHATAVGANSTAKGANVAAIGANSTANADNATAIGIGANATAKNSVAIGEGSLADEEDSVSVGAKGATRRITNVSAGVHDTDAVNVSQLKEGLKRAATDITSSSGAITVVKGTDAKTGSATYDLGLNKNQNFDVVTGNMVVGKVVEATGQLVVDGRATFKDGIDVNNTKIVNVADGVVAPGSKDAVNGGQLHQAMTDTRNAVKDDIDRETGEVGAQAAAMSSLHPLEYDSHHRVSVAAAVGAYKDKTAGAVGAFYRPDDMSMISLQGSFGHNDNMYGLGYSQKFGHSSGDNSVANLSDVKDAMDKLRAENADLKAKYNEIMKMLSGKSGLPLRVVSEVVTTDGANDSGSVRNKVDNMLGMGVSTSEGVSHGVSTSNGSVGR